MKLSSFVTAKAKELSTDFMPEMDFPVEDANVTWDNDEQIIEAFGVLREATEKVLDDEQITTIVKSYSNSKAANRGLVILIAGGKYKGIVSAGLEERSKFPYFAALYMRITTLLAEEDTKALRTFLESLDSVTFRFANRILSNAIEPVFCNVDRDKNIATLKRVFVDYDLIDKWFSFDGGYAAEAVNVDALKEYLDRLVNNYNLSMGSSKENGLASTIFSTLLASTDKADWGIWLPYLKTAAEHGLIIYSVPRKIADDYAAWCLENGLPMSYRVAEHAKAMGLIDNVQDYAKDYLD